MRILYLINYAGNGGSEKYVENLIRAYNNEKCQCFLGYNVDGQLRERLSQEGIKCFKIQMKSPFDIVAAKQLAKICKEKRIDIVHAQYPRENVIANLARLYYKEIKVVYTNHILLQQGFLWKTINKLISNKTDMTIAVCDCGKQLLLKNGFCDDKTTVVYNGAEMVTLEEISKVKDGGIREQLGIDKDTFVICTLARFCAEKRMDYLVEVLSHYKKVYDGNFCCVIAGDGPLLCDVKQKAKDMGVYENIRFLGYRKDAPNIFRASDIYVNTSSNEALSFAIVEAQSFGLACVVTDVGGNKETVNGNFGNGFCVEKDDIQGFADAIHQLATDKQLYEVCCKNARHTAEKVFNIEKSLKDTFSVYQNLLK